MVRRRRTDYGVDAPDDTWACDICFRVWGQYQIDRFGEVEIGLRFHLRGDRDYSSHTLVWKVDKLTGRRYTTLVPSRDAPDHEPFQ